MVRRCIEQTAVLLVKGDAPSVRYCNKKQAIVTKQLGNTSKEAVEIIHMFDYLKQEDCVKWLIKVRIAQVLLKYEITFRLEAFTASSLYSSRPLQPI